MVAKWLRRLCFVLLFLPVLAIIVYLPIIYMAIGSAIPEQILYWLALLVAEVISLVVYFKWPWLAVIISWVDFAVIFTGWITWAGQSLHKFMHQFGFSVLYFAVAHIGLLAWSLRGKPVSTFPTETV